MKMKKIFGLIAVCFAASVFMACSSGDSPVSNTASNANTNTNLAATTSVNGSGNGNTVNAMPNAGMTNAGTQQVVPGLNAPPDGRPIAVESDDNPAATTRPAAPTKLTAPDGSEFSVVLADVATETRTFRSHPQLDKVVRTTSPKGSAIKVYLKGGKVVDLPSRAIKNLRSEPASAILKVAGISTAKVPETAADKKTKSGD